MSGPVMSARRPRGRVGGRREGRRERGRRRRTLLALISLALAACGGTTGPDDGFRFTEATPAGQVIPDQERQAAPEFDGEQLDGTPFASAQLDGGPAVIKFWGSWCPPCGVESPEFQAVYVQVVDQGVQFLGVDVKDRRQLAQAFVQSNAITYPSMFDPSGQVAAAFRGVPANVVPSTIVLDVDRRVDAVYTGAISGDDLTTTLTTLMGELPRADGTT